MNKSHKSVKNVKFLRPKKVIFVVNISNLEYTGGGIDLVSTLKDISPPRAAEPIVLPNSPTSKKPSFFKERIVTSTYIGRNIKQVRISLKLPDLELMTDKRKVSNIVNLILRTCDNEFTV